MTGPSSSAPRVLAPEDYRIALAELETRTSDYSEWFERFAADPSVMDELRSAVDPERPYFVATMGNGIRFMGDARDFASVLSAAYPHCNAVLIGALIAQLGDEGGDVFDVGTNIGVVAASLARHLGERGHVHAFEPTPDTAKLAAATFALNGVRNVTLSEIALGDTDGTITFQSTPGNTAIASMATHDFAFHTEFEPITVPCRRIDTITRERGIERLRLVKIDVEGEELSVLRGGRATFAGQRPTVVYEYTPAFADVGRYTAQSHLPLLSEAGATRFRALVEPPFDDANAPSLWLRFPFDSHVKSQVNVFAD